ncbi:CBS domain-containing protein [Sulfolobus sp. E5-1-F]|uniref:CBS domain-containing protein n=1 Tax=Saccharolobus sp. E5-1-F TaxID=2663019 RepID=UPI0012964D03|nr:CBS domain-containing protein [Sulfolobus sp. E5-1-F]QGA55068.1 CBS domain-containing protein [Sulfolobus sp. E5-1-F]
MQNLSPTQREILLALTDLYNRQKRMIKSKEVADIIGKDEGTVRNIILSLKVLGLVESKPGPNGGYMPTLKAYEIISNPTLTPILDKLNLYKGMIETDIKVENIEIIDITNPSANRVLLKVEGDLRKLKIGDAVRLGPTPYSRLVIEGLVLHLDENSKEIVVDVKRMISIPKEKVKNLISKKLIALKPETSLREASMIFYKEAIRGAPVINKDEKVVGILTTADIIKAFFEGNYTAKVSDYMKTNVISINENEDLLDAIRKMIIYNVGRLLVLDSNNKAVGIVTRTDILRSIAGLEGLWTS